MSLSPAKNRLPTILISHLPLVGVLLIVLAAILLDSSLFEQFRNEQTFALVLVVGIPLGILLGLAQLFIWVRWLIKRASIRSRKIMTAGFAIVLTLFLIFLTLRHIS